MPKIRNNIKVALICTIMPVALSFMFQRHGMYKTAEYVLFSFFTVAFLSLVFAKFGNFIHTAASKTGHFLGKYLAIIALFFVYLLAVLPTGLLMKIVKRDRLRLKKPDLTTYWKKYENENSDYEYQF